jgi:hypothetical protein
MAQERLRNSVEVNVSCLGSIQVIGQTENFHSIRDAILAWIAARIFGVVVACLSREISMLALRPEPYAGSTLP